MTLPEIELRLKDIKESKHIGDIIQLRNDLFIDFIEYIKTINTLYLANKAKKVLKADEILRERLK